MVALHLAGGRGAAAAAERALRAGLGDRLGGQSQLLPAARCSACPSCPTSPSTAPPASAPPTGSWGRSTSTAGAGRWPGSTTASTRAATSGRRSGAEPTLLVPTESAPRPRGGPGRGAAAWARASGRSLSSRLSRRWTGFWPIFFLLVVLKIPVFGALWLVWWASQAARARRARRGRRRRLQALAPAAADRVARAARAARRRGSPSGGGAGASPAGRRLAPQPGGPHPPRPSSPLRSPLSLAPDLAQIGMEVDLDRVTLRGDVALPHPPFLALRSPRASPPPSGSAPRPPSRSATHSRLRLGERHDRPERLDEADEVEAGVLDRDDPAVERQPVVGRREDLRVEEREGDLVAGAVDDEVDLLLAAVGEADGAAAG